MLQNQSLFLSFAVLLAVVAAVPPLLRTSKYSIQYEIEVSVNEGNRKSIGDKNMRQPSSETTDKFIVNLKEEPSKEPTFVENSRMFGSEIGKESINQPDENSVTPDEESKSDEIFKVQSSESPSEKSSEEQSEESSQVLSEISSEKRSEESSEYSTNESFEEPKEEFSEVLNEISFEEQSEEYSQVPSEESSEEQKEESIDHSDDELYNEQSNETSAKPSEDLSINEIFKEQASEMTREEISEEQGDDSTESAYQLSEDNSNENSDESSESLIEESFHNQSALKTANSGVQLNVK